MRVIDPKFHIEGDWIIKTTSGGEAGGRTLYGLESGGNPAHWPSTLI